MDPRKGATLKIDVPNEWAEKFKAFDQAEQILKSNWKKAGVSRLMISTTFGAFGATTRIWHDPAFMVWAALRGCTEAGDFLKRWEAKK
jgi:hypothetical protein